jgi:hypothetical protein
MRGQLARTVLRGGGHSDAISLPAHRRFRRWCEGGVFERVLKALLEFLVRPILKVGEDF